jgi:hypothetical protein
VASVIVAAFSVFSFAGGSGRSPIVVVFKFGARWLHYCSMFPVLLRVVCSLLRR